MSKFNRMKQLAADPGFGSKTAKPTRRLINPDGSFNVVRKGVQRGWRSLYDELISMNGAWFMVFILAMFLGANLLFAGIYYLIGAEYINGGGGTMHGFLECFYFSCQTFTTVGYGALYPTGSLSAFVASIEALTGLLGFAIATGLLWGRFSRPSARLLFSNNAIIAPYKGYSSLQVRLSNRRRNVLLDLEARIIFSNQERVEGSIRRNYYNLELELNKVNFLPLSWTLVHKIDENSPLAGIDPGNWDSMHPEILVLLSGFDNTYYQQVHARFSYIAEEVIFGAKFKPAFETRDDGITYMNINDIHNIEPAELPLHQFNKS